MYWSAVRAGPTSPPKAVTYNNNNNNNRRLVTLAEHTSTYRNTNTKNNEGHSPYRHRVSYVGSG